VSAPAVSASWRALGTTVGLVVRDAAAPAAARRAVEGELAAIDAACSRFRADSELSAVNAAAGRRVRVSPVLMNALSVALRAAVVTDGRVDPTVGRALELAGYDRDFARVRGSRVRRLRIEAVAGWRVVELDRAAGTVRVPAGVSLDLGATAKALAADRAAGSAMAAASGARGVLVNLGGDIATAGTAPPEGWAVRVADSHRAPPDAPGQELRVSSGGLSTSSTTVRRWRRRGGAAHHIVDPRTGAPAVEHWRTVSVAARTCVDANIASTAAIVLGPAAPGWLADARLPARLVTVCGAVVTTADWPAERAVAE
jgi:thiamine biosynthesis lipoprotein